MTETKSTIARPLVDRQTVANLLKLLGRSDLADIVLDGTDDVATRLYTTAEVGKKRGVTERTVRRWIESGRLAAVDIKPPGTGTMPCWRVRHADLVAFTEQIVGAA